MSEIIYIKGPDELKNLLRAAPNVGSGIEIFKYETAKFPFENLVTQYLLDQGHIAKTVALKDVHLFIDSEKQKYSDGVSPVSKRIEETNQQLVKMYHQFIFFLAKNVFKSDLVFERSPFLRFHFPRIVWKITAEVVFFFIGN